MPILLFSFCYNKEFHFHRQIATLELRLVFKSDRLVFHKAKKKIAKHIDFGSTCTCIKVYIF